MNVLASRKGINFLGVLTEDGETLLLECTGSFTKDVTMRLLQVLQAKFGEKLVVVLDKGTYFTAKKIKQFVEETKIELLYLPIGPSISRLCADHSWRSNTRQNALHKVDGKCGIGRSRIPPLTALDAYEP